MKHEINMGNETYKDYSFHYVVDGQVIESFEDQQTAEQFFDEDTANCQQLANDMGESMRREVIDDSGRVKETVLTDIINYQRNKFIRDGRSKLEEISGYAIGMLEGIQVQVSDAGLRQRIDIAIKYIRERAE